MEIGGRVHGAGRFWSKGSHYSSIRQTSALAQTQARCRLEEGAVFHGARQISWRNHAIGRRGASRCCRDLWNAPYQVQNFSVPRVKISIPFMTTPSASTPNLVDEGSLAFLFSAASPKERAS